MKKTPSPILTTIIHICCLFSFSRLYSQNVGIGIPTPLTKLHVFNGASGTTPYSQFSPLAIESNGHTYINLLSPAASETAILFGSGTSTNGVIMFNNTSTPNGFQFRNNGNLTRMVINNGGNVGIGTISPNALLSLSANGAELEGTTASNTFRTNAGNLNNTVSSELGLTSLGLLAGNNVSLGIRAFRNVLPNK